MEEYIKIGKINLTKLGKILVSTDDVILTFERIEHIKEKHKEQFYELKDYIKVVIEDPDYILQEMNHVDTIIMLKEIVQGNFRVKMIIKLATNKNENKSNSIITFWKIRQRDYLKTIQKSKIIYQKLDKNE